VIAWGSVLGALLAGLACAVTAASLVAHYSGLGGLARTALALASALAVLIIIGGVCLACAARIANRLRSSHTDRGQRAAYRFSRAMHRP